MNSDRPSINSTIKGEIWSYKITAVLGNGSISQVFKAVRENDEQVFAIKYVSSKTFIGENQNRYYENEIEISKKIMQIQSKNLLNIFEVIQIDQDSTYIVMEFCDKCDLFSFSLSFMIDWETAIEFGYQIASGINDLHKFNITHRDLKPENIFVSSFKNSSTNKVEYNLKIGDFGLSKEGDIYQSQVGTPNYMCPETYKQGDKTKETDIWAFGLILFELIQKRQYFQAQNTYEIYGQIRTFKAYDRTMLTYVENEQIGEKINNLIASCVDINPKNRISSSQLLEELRSILDEVKNIPQKKNHIQLRIPSHQFKQSEYSSIYFVHQEGEEEEENKMFYQAEKKFIPNIFNQQIKKVESELVEYSPDSQNLKESVPEKSYNQSIFFNQQKSQSFDSNMERSNDQQFHFNAMNIQQVTSKLISNPEANNQISEEMSFEQRDKSLDYQESDLQITQEYVDKRTNEAGNLEFSGSLDERKTTPSPLNNNSFNNLNNGNNSFNTNYNMEELKQSQKMDGGLHINKENINEIYCIDEMNSSVSSKQTLFSIQSTIYMKEDITKSKDESKPLRQAKENDTQQYFTNFNDESQIQVIYQQSEVQSIQSQPLIENQNGTIQSKIETQSQLESNSCLPSQEYQEFVNLAIQILEYKENNLQNPKKKFQEKYNIKEIETECEEYKKIILSDQKELNKYIMFFLLLHSLVFKKNEFYKQLKAKSNIIDDYNLDKVGVYLKLKEDVTFPNNQDNQDNQDNKEIKVLEEHDKVYFKVKPKYQNKLTFQIHDELKTLFTPKKR